MDRQIADTTTFFKGHKTMFLRWHCPLIYAECGVMGLILHAGISTKSPHGSSFRRRRKKYRETLIRVSPCSWQSHRFDQFESSDDKQKVEYAILRRYSPLCWCFVFFFFFLFSGKTWLSFFNFCRVDLSGPNFVISLCTGSGGRVCQQPRIGETNEYDEADYEITIKKSVKRLALFFEPKTCCIIPKSTKSQPICDCWEKSGT